MKRDAIKSNKDRKIPSKPDDKDKEKDSEDSDGEIDSGDVSDVFDTPLTLKHSSDDVIFNNIDNDEVTEIAEDNDDDAMSDIFDTPLTWKHSSNTDDDVKYNQIIPSLKTWYAFNTLLKDSSLQNATHVIKSNYQVPKFTAKLDKHDTQGWEQVEHPKRRSSDKTGKSAKQAPW